MKSILIDKLFIHFYPPTCLYCHSNNVTSYDDLCINCWKEIQFNPSSFSLNRSCTFNDEMNTDQDNPYQEITSYDPNIVNCYNNFSNYHGSSNLFSRSSRKLSKQIFSITCYDGIIREMIHKFKFENHRYLRKFFAKLLRLALIEISKKSDVSKNLSKSQSTHASQIFLIPVPMHVSKLRQRTYNQAGLLSDSLSQIIPSLCLMNFLQKTKKTEMQSTLSFSDRMKNVKNAFKINSKYEKKYTKIIYKSHELCNNHKQTYFIVIDDIVTTGATMESCIEVIESFLQTYYQKNFLLCTSKVLGLSIACT